MEIFWKRKEAFLTTDSGLRVPCSCIVRNELNKWRLPKEVVHTKPDRLPYYPRRFPLGKWKVGAPVPTSDPYMAPFYIPTDAFLEVEIWEVEDGKYKSKSDKKVIDRSYGLHFAETSTTTLGCIRIASKEKLLELVAAIREKYSEGVWITVTEE